MIHSNSQFDFNDALNQVRQAAQELIAAGVNRQSELLEVAANELEQSQDTILEANTLDLEASLEMAVPERVIDWLKLTPERLQLSIKILRRLASLGDPRILIHQSTSQLTPAAGGFTQVVPLGVIALIYEAFPELAVVAAGLCWRTGNGLILKGGNESSQTTQIVADLLQRALVKVKLPEDVVMSLTAEQGDMARTWLLQAEGVDLVVPYGRPSLVQQVMRQATVPVLPTAMGNCYLYWSETADLDRVVQIIVDSHQGEPDAVNSIEKVLIHGHHSHSSIAQLCRHLWEKGFRLRAETDLRVELPDLNPVDQNDWSLPFLTKMVAFRRVSHLKEAITLINRHSSGHADCIITDSYQEACDFSSGVRSAVIFINASPRFSRNPTQAAAIALGMTTQRGSYSGLVGLNAFMAVKHIIQGR